MSRSSTRRQFLKQFGAAGIISLGGLPPRCLTRAAEIASVGPDKRILVMVQLAGGNEGLNTLVPHGEDA